MSEETMLTIKTKLDTKGLDDLEVEAGRSLDSISRDVDAFNKSTKVSPDTKEFKKKIEEASKLLEELTAKREIVIAKPRTEAVQKELNKLDDIIRQTTRTREILIRLDEVELAKTESTVKDVTDGLDKIEEKRNVDISAPDTEKVEKKVQDINDKLDKVEKPRKIRFNIEDLDMNRVQAGFSSLVKTLSAVTAAAIGVRLSFIGMTTASAKMLDSIDKQSQKIGMTTESFQEFSYIAKQSGTSIESLTGAMTTLTKKAADNSKGFKALGISVKDSNGNLKNQETLLKETVTALQGVESGTARSRVAYELFGLRAKELEPLLNAGANSMENLRKEAHEFGLVLDRETIAKGAAATASFDKMSATLKNVLVVALAGALPYITDFYEGIANWGKEIAPLAQNLVPTLASALDALIPVLAGLATYITTYAVAMAAVPVATAAASVATFTFAGAIEALTVAIAANPIGAIAVALAALVTAIVWAVRNWDYFVAQMLYGAKSIEVALSRTFVLFETVAINVFEAVHTAFYNMMREIVQIALNSVQGLLDTFGELPGSLGEPFREGAERVREFNRAVSDGLKSQVNGIQSLAAARIAENDRIIAEHDAELKRIGEERDAKLAALEDTKQKQRELDREEAPTGGAEIDLTAFKKGEEDKIAALKARYAAQREIAAATITDQKELTDALTGFEKAYYAELEKLLLDNYEKQIAKGKALTDAQIAELKRVRDERKKFETSALDVLDKEYAARVNIARRTISTVEDQEKEVLKLRLEYLQKRLELLLAEAEAAEKAGQAFSKPLQEEIAKLRLQIAAVKKELEMEDTLKTIASQIEKWGGLLNNMVSNIGDFMNAQYDARIQALDKTLDRELRMLENAFEQQNALYEEQLKQYENLEERRTEIQDEYNDARERLNWKAQEHVTEDEYLAIMAQMAQEEEKYNDSMMRLEEDTLQRDAIRLAQEQAEQEYLARKEQLEKEYAIKRAQMERKQAQSQQAQAIFSAVIFTAVGIARALSEFIWPLNIAVGAIVAAAGAVQIAAIASRPLPSIPSYHVGGLIGGSNIQDYGHLPGPDNPHDKTLFWGQEGEYVLPKAESQAYQFLRAHGHNLTGLVDRVLMRSEMSIPASTAVVAPVTHNTQQVTYQVKNPLTFSEARRLQEKANRAFLRGLA